MLSIKTLIVGQLKTNCYILAYSEKRLANRNCIIIDPGDDAEYIRQTIQDQGLTPKLIIATHAHFDHLLAVNELKLAFKIPFAIHKNDEVLLSWYRKSAIRFTDFDPGPPPFVDQYLVDGKLKTQNPKLKIYESPGHTPGGVCLYNSQEKIIFTGDTLFAHGAIGRYDFPYCDKEKLLKSVTTIKKKFAGFTAYPGHGESFQIK